MVGGAEALPGLVFIAMTLSLDDITNDPVHRHPARTTLTVFIRRTLVLTGGQEPGDRDRAYRRRL